MASPERNRAASADGNSTSGDGFSFETSASAGLDTSGGSMDGATVGAAAAAFLGKSSLYEAQIAARISLGAASGIISVGESLGVVQMP